MDELLFADGARRRAYMARIRALAPIGYWPLDDAAASIQARNLAQLSGNLVSNGDLEATADFDRWSVSQPDGTVTVEASVVHGGAKAAKLTCGASGNTYIDQTFCLTAGKTYTLTFWTQGDGTRGGGYDLYDVTNAAYIEGPRLASGVTGAAYQQVTKAFTVPATCKAVMLRFYCPAFNTAFCYVDDVAITDVVPSASALNTTFGGAGIGDGRTAAALAGSGAVDVYSAALAAAFSGDEGTVSAWWAVDAAATWSDAAQRVAVEILGNAGSGGFHFAKTATAGVFQATRVVTGGTVSCNWEGLSGTAWHHTVMAWSKGEALIHGSLDGGVWADQAYPGDWSGVPIVSSTCIGAYNNTGVTQGFKGAVAHVAVWDRCLGASVRKALARK